MNVNLVGKEEENVMAIYKAYEEKLKSSLLLKSVDSPNLIDEQNMTSEMTNFHSLEDIPKLEIQLKDAINLGDNIPYDFDVLVFGDRTLLVYAIQNKYQLYLLDNKSEKLTLLRDQEFKILDSHQKDCQESFFKVKFIEVFSDNKECPDLNIALGGVTGVLYLINIDLNFTIENLLGHVTEIYDICVPYQSKDWQNMLLSCSKDRSIFLWNVYRKMRIAHFRDESQIPTDAVSLDFHPTNQMFASSFYDGTISFWEIDEKIMHRIIDSHQTDFKKKILEIRKATFTTRDIHQNTCDSIKFIGDLIASRDTHGNIKLSLMTKVISRVSLNQIGVIIANQMKYESQENIWFVQLGYDPAYSLLYIGNDTGVITFWRKSGKQFKEILQVELPVKKVIRKALLTTDKNYLFAISDDGNAWIHKISENFKKVFEENKIHQ